MLSSVWRNWITHICGGNIKWCSLRISLVVQWLRICLPLQGVQIGSLVRELRSHKPQGTWACEPQLERSLHASVKIPCATVKTWLSQKYKWYSLSGKQFQFSSVAQSCLTLFDPMNHSTPGPPVHHQLLEFTQTHVHRVSDAIQPSHPLSSPSPPAPNPLAIS